MKYYKDRAKVIMEPELNKFSINFIDYQVEVQKMLNREIKINNKRRLQDFIENSRQFLCDNFYYYAQVYFICSYINKICILLSDSFEKNIKLLLKEILSEKDIDELISECFLNKFREFENKVQFFEDNNNRKHTNNYENNNLQNNQKDKIKLLKNIMLIYQKDKIKLLKNIMMIYQKDKILLKNIMMIYQKDKIQLLKNIMLIYQ